MQEEEKDLRSKKPSGAVNSAIAVLTAAGVAISGAVDSPSELIEGEPVESPVTSTQLYTEQAEIEAAEDEDDDESKRRPGIRASVRQSILRMPLAVRLLVIAPLWLLGSLVTAGGSLLFSSASPVLARILGAILPAIAFVAAFLLSAKAVFPDLPLKKIINKRTAPWLLFGAGGLVAVNILLGLFWDDYEEFKNAVSSLLILAALIFAMALFVRHELKRRLATELPSDDEATHDPDSLVFETYPGETFHVKVPKDK